MTGTPSDVSRRTFLKAWLASAAQCLVRLPLVRSLPMTRQWLQLQPAHQNGLTPGYTQPPVDGLLLSNDGRVLLLVVNTNAGPLTLTLETPGVYDGNPVTPKQVVIPSGGTRIFGRLDPLTYNQPVGLDAGTVYLDFSVQSGVLVAAFYPGDALEDIAGRRGGPIRFTTLTRQVALAAALGVSGSTRTTLVSSALSLAGIARQAAGTAAFSAAGAPATTSRQVAASASFGNAFYVSPSAAGSGDGSLANPWTIAQISTSTPPAAITPGSYIYLRGGTYTTPAMDTVNRNIWVWRFAGTSGKPVTVTSYPGEWAKIVDTNDVVALGITAQAIIQVNGQYVNVENVEITASYTTYLSSGSQRRTPGIKPNTINVNFRHLVVHDTGINILDGGSSNPGEIYGCISYNAGAASTEHCIYAENNIAGSVRSVRNNICFNPAGYALHIYDSNPIRDITLDRNIAWNGGVATTSATNDWRANILIQTDSTTVMDGTHIGALDPTLTNNCTYYPAVAAKSVGDNTVRLGKAGATTGTINLIAESNYFVNMDTRASSTAIEVNAPYNPTVDGNTLVGNRPSGFDAAYPSNTTYAPGTPPTTNQVFVFPDAYIPGRAHIAIYNWQSLSSVSVNLSAVLVLGQRYEIRNVQTYFGTPVVSNASYDGNPVALPMAAVSPPTPVVTPANTIPSTGTQFHTFVVLPL